jgi:hypothetical protein
VKPNKPLIVEEFKKCYLESSIHRRNILLLRYSKRDEQLRKQLRDNPKKNKITLYMAISEEKIVGYKLTKTHGNSNDFLEFLKSIILRY